MNNDTDKPSRRNRPDKDITFARIKHDLLALVDVSFDELIGKGFGEFNLKVKARHGSICEVVAESKDTKTVQL